ncbi:DNA helicase PcrA [Clostridiisalibacter paucivorans]|uniref:DNA helicase PcrA n=1 Tax=Clostridiisalibacter paucivorans TaxID=408753 RepID=UPI00047D64B5|nr:DNA helicase PcrA [Clostridiisalibacter paucivorans]
MSFLDGLNEMQQEAVRATEGPLLILAGAGSGKTRVLTHRIAYLIEENNILPENILAITFTNKAAGEMKERLGNLIDYRVDGMWVGTFHSICVRILRRDIEKLGYGKNFVIFDTDDQMTLIKDCLKEKDVNPKLFDPRATLRFIGSQKDILVDPDTYIKDNFTDFRERTKGELYELYQKKLKENNALDFDDLIGKTIELFKNSPDVLDFYRRKFRYVLVDEYQDTNRAQYQLIRLLSSKYKNVCVVGDADQSIYGWRGADIRNILDFESDYSNAKTIKLEQNYRSTKNILKAANCVIENNCERKEKNLWTSNDAGHPIKIYNADNEHDEGNFIAKTIKNMIEKKDMSYSDFAILYRTNAQSRVLEESMLKFNISYKIVGGLKFYDRKEIKDIVAYLRLIQNPLDNYSLKRIINVPKRGIGKRTVEKIEAYSTQREESMYSLILDAQDIPGLSHRAMTLVSNFATMIGKFIAMKELVGVKALIEDIINSTGYVEELERDGSVEARTRIENIKEFISVAIDFEERSEESTLEDFLANISLLSDVDKTDDDKQDSVTLMTLHSAKGLEFPVVFLSGMEDGIFPISRALTSEDDMEEERRLCYVGVTRAEKVLYLTYTDVRTIYGKTTYNSISRFINEMPQSLIESCREKHTSSKNENTKAKDYSKNNKKKYFTGYTYENTGKDKRNSPKVLPGSKVMHKKWGIGTVVQVKDKNGDSEVSIAFEGQGVKNLLLSMAPIELLD